MSTDLDTYILEPFSTQPRSRILPGARVGAMFRRGKLTKRVEGTVERVLREVYLDKEMVLRAHDTYVVKYLDRRPNLYLLVTASGDHIAELHD